MSTILLIMVPSRNASGGMQDLLADRFRPAVHEIGVIGTTDLILGAFDVASGRDGTIIVADKLEGNVKVFDQKGNVVRRIDVGLGAARRLRDPAFVEANGEGIAVAALGGRHVYLLDGALKEMSMIEVPGAVLDLAFDGAGSLWVGAWTGEKNDGLFHYDRQGLLRRRVPLRHTSGKPFVDFFLLATGHRGEVAVIFTAVNKIEIWDTSGRFQREFACPGIIPRSPARTPMKGSRTQNPGVPDGNVLWGGTYDHSGRLYVLAGDHSPLPYREVAVFDPQGKRIGEFTLPRAASAIRMNTAGELYTIETNRTIVRKYRLR